MHVITGMPRSGSTLLCNILNQNDEFYASSTSPMASIINNMVSMFTNSPEVKGDLINDKETTENRVCQSMIGSIEGWYGLENRKIFDKSRGWTSAYEVFFNLYPDSKMIIMVRDLRAIFGSMEKQHRKTPMFDEGGNEEQKTSYVRASNKLSNDGIIGVPLLGVEDCLRRNHPGCIFVRYEDFAADPELIMRRIYKHIGEEYYEHDFDNVENVASDVDGLYWNKYPHKGSGKVESVNDWKDYIAPDVSELIMQQGVFYNTQFNY